MQKQELSSIIVSDDGKINFNFKKLDTFYHNYGHSLERFIVKEILFDAVVCTGPYWCKKSVNMIISFSNLEKDPYFKMGKKYSRWKWFWKT